MYSAYAKIRDSFGDTDYRVAKETGITMSTLYDWKHGRSKPKTEKLLKIAKYFGVSIELLIGEEVDICQKP